MKTRYAALSLLLSLACKPSANIAIPEAQVKTDDGTSAGTRDQDPEELGNEDPGVVNSKETTGDEPADKTETSPPQNTTPNMDMGQTPGNTTTPSEPKTPETPPPPKYYLYCFKDKVESAKATVYCAVHDTASKKYFKASNVYVSLNWSYSAPSTATVTAQALPAKHRYNVMYTVTAKTADAVTATLSGVTFKLDATDVSDKIDKFEKKGVDTRIEMFVQSLKPQNNQGNRCFDRNRMNSKQIVTTPCNSNSLAHDWWVTPEGKIAHVTGECLAFDTYDSMAIVGDCDTGVTQKFDFNGEQIKIRGTNNCLGLKNQDLSGVDYAASVACNTGDNQQKWKVSPGALP